MDEGNDTERDPETSGASSELLMSNQQPWAVPSSQPVWYQGALWEPASPKPASDVHPQGSEQSDIDVQGSRTYGGGPGEPREPGEWGGWGGPGEPGEPGGPPGPGDDGEPWADSPRRGRKIAALAVAAVVIAGAGAGAGIAYLTRQNPGSTSGAGLAASPAGSPLTKSQIAAAVDPAVVDINTNIGAGTGMIATSNGEIVTNNHVVEGASSIQVVIADRGTFTGRVVGTDASGDVAVLSVGGVKGLPTVKFGNSSDARVGDFVVAIGNAGGRGGTPAATTGTISALGRSINASDQTDVGQTLENLKGMIQMDARIVPGNSGGPLVNSSGQVIGMDTAAVTVPSGGPSVGFALPINRVLQVANAIEQGRGGDGIVIGVRPLLGIEGQTVSLGGSGPKSGAGLAYVVPGTPAALAGLQPGDVIVAFDGHPTPTMESLATLIHKRHPGDRVTVTFEDQNGNTQTVTVTLAAMPPA